LYQYANTKPIPSDNCNILYRYINVPGNITLSLKIIVLNQQRMNEDFLELVPHANVFSIQRFDK